MEATFPWLTVPHPDQMDATIRAVYGALGAMRGYSVFATFGKALCCDFFIPSEQLLIEYDERQHFTLQRATALELYPADLELQFNKSEWREACRSIQATDPTPPNRDEQRAFYDSLRDILAARNGVRLIRLRYGSYDWTGPGADEQLSLILDASVPSPVAQATQDACPATEAIKKIAVVSHDYNVADKTGHYDYSEDLARINRICDEQGCNTILYALYTWRKDSPQPRNHDALFAGLSYVRRVILELGHPFTYDNVEVWQRGRAAPAYAKQRFARSSDASFSKQAFLDDLESRRIGDALLVICGETNITSTVRGSNDFYDPFRFTDRLREMKISLILNPIHDYMTRHEMRKKRRYYSLGGRTVISVWNQGRGKESHLPWTLFHDGVERTEAVRELPRPFSDRPDIRIGIVDVSQVSLTRTGATHEDMGQNLTGRGSAMNIQGKIEWLSDSATRVSYVTSPVVMKRRICIDYEEDGTKCRLEGHSQDGFLFHGHYNECEKSGTWSPDLGRTFELRCCRTEEATYLFGTWEFTSGNRRGLWIITLPGYRSPAEDIERNG
jgi:hypothetical protein